MFSAMSSGVMFAVGKANRCRRLNHLRSPPTPFTRCRAAAIQRGLNARRTKMRKMNLATMMIALPALAACDRSQPQPQAVAPAPPEVTVARPVSRMIADGDEYAGRFVAIESVEVRATGAGAELRQALGTAVFAGMIGVTVFGLIFTPGFYAICRWLTCVGWRRRPVIVPVSTPAE
jgi:hypothetical protein